MPMHHHPSSCQALSCHHHALYPSSTDLGRRRFIQLATLGSGIALFGLATPWWAGRAETGPVPSPQRKTDPKVLHEPPLQHKTNLKTQAEAASGHGADSHAGAAGGHTAEALLLSCMDFRLIDDITRYMDSRGMTNQYDHVVLAGASLGAITNHCKEWNKTFWEHLKIASDLHQIKKVILMDHRDCGAYKVILKADFSKDPQLETRIHGKFMRDLMVAIHKRYPELEVERLMMNLDGAVQKIS